MENKKLSMDELKNISGGAGNVIRFSAPKTTTKFTCSNPNCSLHSRPLLDTTGKTRNGDTCPKCGSGTLSCGSFI